MTGRNVSSSPDTVFQHEELSAISESKSTAIITIDLNGIIKRWSIGAQCILGHTDSEITGTSWQALSPADQRSALTKSLDKIKRGRSVPEFETSLVCKNGRIIDVNFAIHPVYDHKKAEITAATLVISDISSRKKVESALNESLQTIETIINTVPDGIVTLDQFGNIESVNPAIATMFQYRPHELIGCDISVLFPDSCRSENAKYINDYLNERTSTIKRHNWESFGIKKDGSIFPVEIALNVLTSDSKLGLVSVIKDISERREHEARLKDQYEKIESTNRELEKTLKDLRETQDQLILSEKMASLGSLVAGVAHEINTPIGIGVTAASNLNFLTEEIAEHLTDNTLKRSELNHFLESAKDSSGLILRNLDRAAKLIGSFKRVAVDQSTNDIRDFGLLEYLEEILQSLTPTLKKSGVTVDIDCSSKIHIRSNPGSLYQVISNLLINATIHAFDEQKKARMEITVRESDEHIEISVSDNGKGIPQQNLSKIFEPFFTTRRGQGGSGLGLNITYNLVTQSMGGKIAVDSQVGRGTTFIITLPKDIGKQ